MTKTTITLPRLALIATLLVAAAGCLEQAPSNTTASAQYGLTKTCVDSLYFDGECRAVRWIKTQLLDSNETFLIAAGQTQYTDPDSGVLEPGSGAHLWVLAGTEDHTTALHLSNQATDGRPDRGGYRIVERFDVTAGTDGDGQEYVETSHRTPVKSLNAWRWRTLETQTVTFQTDGSIETCNSTGCSVTVPESWYQSGSDGECEDSFLEQLIFIDCAMNLIAFAFVESSGAMVAGSLLFGSGSVGTLGGTTILSGGYTISNYVLAKASIAVAGSLAGAATAGATLCDDIAGVLGDVIDLFRDCGGDGDSGTDGTDDGGGSVGTIDRGDVVPATFNEGSAVNCAAYDGTIREVEVDHGNGCVVDAELSNCHEDTSDPSAQQASCTCDAKVVGGGCGVPATP